MSISDQPDNAGQSYQIPPGYQPPPLPRSGLPGWAIALIVGVSLIVVLCIAGSIVSIGMLTLLGGQVSAVFSQIESDLETISTTTPVEIGEAYALGDSANLPNLRITVIDSLPLTEVPDSLKPQAGNQYCAVEVEFENTSEDPVTLSAFASFVQNTSEGS